MDKAKLFWWVVAPLALLVIFLFVLVLGQREVIGIVASQGHYLCVVANDLVVLINQQSDALDSCYPDGPELSEVNALNCDYLFEEWY